MSEEILTRKEKRYAKIREKITSPNDIKYRGPLSYRYVRILAWVLFALGQMLVIGDFFQKFFAWNYISSAGHLTVEIFSSIATPLFIVASFGLALSGQKTFKQLITTYAIIFGGMVLGLNLLYYRYLVGIFTSAAAEKILSHLSFITRANVFCDLLMFALFHFFVNYRPTKYFQGKKRIIFRLFVILPILYVIAAYVVKVLLNHEYITVPFAILPFLTTKSPMVFLVFALVSLWLKNRHNFLTKKIGLTRHEYNAYLKTNKNSFSFSVVLSIIIAIFGLLELIGIFIMIAVSGDEYLALYAIYYYSYGDAFMMILAIPFILLYSYTRAHKNTSLDIFVPISGIAMSIIVYLEVILAFMNQTR